MKWYVIFPKANTSTNIIIQKQGMCTNKSRGKAINVFGYDFKYEQMSHGLNIKDDTRLSYNKIIQHQL